jgi:hypothetical protein
MGTAGSGVRKGFTAAIVTLAVIGVAMAAGATVTPNAPPGEATKQLADAAGSSRSDPADTTGSHGGSVERFHDAGSCTLTDVTALSGNWTHGDYVSAVAQGGDATQIREAAQSDCGMPIVSIQQGAPNQAQRPTAGGQARKPTDVPGPPANLPSAAAAAQSGH